MTRPTSDPMAVNLNMVDVMAAAGVRMRPTGQFGPSGLTWRIVTPDHRAGSIIVTQAVALDGKEWLHASLALDASDPTYADLVLLHRAVFGRHRWAALLFAPAAQHVNIHEHALHLWGPAAPDDWPLPDFTHGMGSI